MFRGKISAFDLVCKPIMLLYLHKQGKWDLFSPGIFQERI